MLIFFKKNEFIDGNLFLGYPILPTIDDKISTDALIISPKYGIIVFIFYNETKEINFENLQEEIYSAILSKLVKEKSLIKQSSLLIDLNVIIYAPNFSRSFK